MELSKILQGEKWVYGSILRDFWILYFPPLIVILYYSLFRSLDEMSWHRLFLALIALVMIDNGHVFATFWRTYFNPHELYRTKIYIYTPLLIFFGCIAFSKFNYQRFWTFVVYAAMYHNIRQLYGYYKWYGAINRFFDRPLDYLLYAYCYLPVLIFHTAPPRITKGYFDNDIYNFHHPTINQFIWGIYILSLIGGGLYVYWLKRHNRPVPIGQLGFLLLSGLIYNRAFIPSLTRTEMMQIVAVPHGVAYILSTAFIATKVQRQEALWITSGKFDRPLLLEIFKKLKPELLFGVVIVSSILWGIGDYILDDFYLDITNPNQTLFTTVLSAIWITPLLSHYYFDAVIWRHKHPEFRFITDT